MPWTDCRRGHEEVAPGSATQDRECAPASTWRVPTGRADDVIRAIRLWDDGTLTALGFFEPTARSYVVFAERFDRDGNSLTRDEIAIPDDEARTPWHMTADEDGHLYVLTNGPESRRRWIGKGTRGSWVWTVEAPADSMPRDICVDGRGEVIVVGSHYVRKYAASSRLLLELSPAAYQACAVDGDDDFYLAGEGVTKRRPDGAVLWEASNAPYTTDVALAVGDDESVLVMGRTPTGRGEQMSLLQPQTGEIALVTSLPEAGSFRSVSWRGPIGAGSQYAGGSTGDGIAIVLEYPASGPSIRHGAGGGTGERVVDVQDDGNGVFYGAVDAYGDASSGAYVVKRAP